MAKIELRPEDRKALEEADETLQEGSEMIAKMEAAGFDVSEYRVELDRAKAQRDFLLKEF